MTISPDARERLQIPPCWLQAVLLLEALSLWVFLAALTFFLPEGWSTLFNLPFRLAQLLALAGAGLLSLLAAMAWLAPRHKWLRYPFAIYCELFSRPLSLILAGVPLLPGLFFLSHSGWWGYSLLGTECALIALSFYLANPIAWDSRSNMRLVVIAAVIIAIGLGLRVGILFLDWIWTDEGFYLSTAINMLTSHQIAPAMMCLPDEVPIHPFYGHAVGLYGLWGRVVGVSLLPLLISYAALRH